MSCSTPAPTDWAAFAAIDWGSRQHAWSLLPAQGGSVQSGVLRSTPEAVELWAMDLYQRFSACPIAVAVEQKRGPLVYMLGKYDHLVLHPVPPTMSASYRRAFIPSGAKSDPGDAQLLLDLLLHHREHLRPSLPKPNRLGSSSSWSSRGAISSSRRSTPSCASPPASSNTFPSSAPGSVSWTRP